MKLVIIVPAFNEEEMIGQVIDQLVQKKPKNMDAEIVVVNDGSWDKTGSEAKKRKVTVISHLINRGLGGALGTGLAYARKVRADLAVTFDADGQHNPDDVEKVLKPLIEKKADVVIGSRLIGKSHMPSDRKILNYIANITNFLLWGVWVTDSQSGLRGFAKSAIEKIEIKMNRMEVSSEFLKEAGRHNLSIEEVPIKATYTRYSLGKGQKDMNAVNIFIKLLLHRLVNIK